MKQEVNLIRARLKTPGAPPLPASYFRFSCVRPLSCSGFRCGQRTILHRGKSAIVIAVSNATQAEISRAFGVPLITVKRYVKLYREHGAAAFFAPAKKRSGSKLTAEVCQQVQGLLDQGLTVPEVGRELGILSNTLLLLVPLPPKP